MKHTFKLGAVTIEELGLKVEGIEITTEYSIVEAKGAYDIARKAINELPLIIEDLGDCYKTVTRIEEEIQEHAEEKHRARAEAVRNMFGNILETLKNASEEESEKEDQE